jgi:lysozyme
MTNQQQFQKLLTSWGITNFTAAEFFFRGGSDAKLQLNTDPPAALWPNMERTAKTLQEARNRLGKPIRITSAYRDAVYNRKIGGVPNSTHVQFNALDLVTDKPAALYLLLLDLRREGLFKGGLGLYRSFVHLDSRGHNATWRR